MRSKQDVEHLKLHCAARRSSDQPISPLTPPPLELQLAADDDAAFAKRPSISSAYEIANGESRRRTRKLSSLISPVERCSQSRKRPTRTVRRRARRGTVFQNALSHARGEHCVADRIRSCASACSRYTRAATVRLQTRLSPLITQDGVVQSLIPHSSSYRLHKLYRIQRGVCSVSNSEFEHVYSSNDCFSS